MITSYNRHVTLCHLSYLCVFTVKRKILKHWVTSIWYTFFSEAYILHSNTGKYLPLNLWLHHKKSQPCEVGGALYAIICKYLKVGYAALKVFCYWKKKNPNTLTIMFLLWPPGHDSKDHIEIKVSMHWWLDFHKY